MLPFESKLEPGEDEGDVELEAGPEATGLVRSDPDPGAEGDGDPVTDAESEGEGAAEPDGDAEGDAIEPSLTTSACSTDNHRLLSSADGACTTVTCTGGASDEAAPGLAEVDVVGEPAVGVPLDGDSLGVPAALRHIDVSAWPDPARPVHGGVALPPAPLDPPEDTPLPAAPSAGGTMGVTSSAVATSIGSPATSTNPDAPGSATPSAP